MVLGSSWGAKGQGASVLGTSPVGVPSVPPAHARRRSSGAAAAEGPGSASASLRSPLMGPSPSTPLPELMAPLGRKGFGGAEEPAGRPSLVGFSVAHRSSVDAPGAAARRGRGAPPAGALSGGGISAALVADEKGAGRAQAKEEAKDEALLWGARATSASPASPPEEERALYADLLEEALERAPRAFSTRLVVRALSVAASAHAGQLRRSGEPVVRHALETALLLADQGLDDAVVAAGLLHDTLDDTMMTEDALREMFPTDVVDMVVGVSRMSLTSQLHRESARDSDSTSGLDSKGADRFKAMLFAMADVRVVLIKLADRLHNMRTLEHLPEAKQRGMARETLHVFAPLANRLGIWNVKAELEDLCFKHLEPEQYALLKSGVNNERNLGLLLQALEALKQRLDARGLECRDLLGRPKHLYGIFGKMQAKGVGLDEIYDACALRVIVDSEEDCYAALEEVHGLWEPLPQKTKDYIASPKPNGYQSLHTVVRTPTGECVEVQIRTSEMHYTAEYGVAAHWNYKERSRKPGQSNADARKDRLAQRVAWARWLLSWQMEVQDMKFRPSGSPGSNEGRAALERFPEAEPQPPSDEGLEYDPIYVLAVNGEGPGKIEVLELPGGTTAEALSERLASGGAAGDQLLVNQRIHSSKQVLRMGDQIEMVSSGYAEEFFESDVEDASFLSDGEESDLEDPEFEFEREKLARMYSGRGRKQRAE